MEQGMIQSSSLILVALVVVLFLIVALILVALAALKRRQTTNTAREVEPQEHESDEPWPYVVSPHFLSPGELDFHAVLMSAANDAVVVSPKVNLGDVFYVKVKGKAFYSWRGRITQKHVDFLLCEPHTMKPVLGIELDDASHQRQDRRERDDTVDRVFEAAGLPLLHVPARASYDADELVESIRGVFVA